MKKTNILLPDHSVGQLKSERILSTLDVLFRWATSEPIQKMFSLFGYTLSTPDTLKEWYKVSLPQMHRFAADNWDIRKNRERFEINESNYSPTERGKILELVEAAGYINVLHTMRDTERVLILGGAKKANYMRPKRAKEIADTINGIKEIEILTAHRELNKLEYDVTKEFAPEATTEREALIEAVAKLFGISKTLDTVLKCENGNPFLTSSIESFTESYNGIRIKIITAPSSSSERRADSRDAYNYYFEHSNIAVGSRVLAVTSSAFVPYQYISFFDHAIENDINAYFNGNEFVTKSEIETPPELFLQEVKATFDALTNFYRKYSYIL